jgi:type IV pilus assembly protein PilA
VCAQEEILIDLKLVASCLLLTGLVLSACAAICNAISVQRRVKKNIRKSEAAYSLAELMICVCVVLTLMGLALPSLLASRQRANEASAVGSVKAVLSANTLYNSSYGTYSPDLASLSGVDGACTAQPSSACILDSVTASGLKSSYKIIYTGDGATPSVSFKIIATPISGYAGQWEYCSNEADQIYYDQPGSCVPGSSAVLP